MIPKEASEIIIEVNREPDGCIKEGEAINSIQRDERAGKVSQAW